MSNSALNELGFAEFVAKLISDTFDAILTAQSEQTQKINELESIVNLEDEALLTHFQESADASEQIEATLQQLFPNSQTAFGHSVIKDSAYRPKSSTKAESPDYQAQLGVTLEPNQDYKNDKLTQNGVDKIYQACLQQLALAYRQHLTQVVQQGLPQLVVDSGKIKAKLTFSSDTLENPDSESTPEDENSPTIPSSALNNLSSSSSLYRGPGITPLHRFNLPSRRVGQIDPKRFINTRLTIKPASNLAPQDAQSSADIYSEVEIHFKALG